MVIIYCLVDPRDMMPFYVGATKTALSKRLCGHISDANWLTKIPKNFSQGHAGQKRRLILDIMSAGLRPLINNVTVTDNKSADFYETFIYKHFIFQGYDLIQKPPISYWQSTKPTEKYLRRKYQLRRYSQLCFKNILIIIW